MSEVTPPIKLELNLCEPEAGATSAAGDEDDLKGKPKRNYKLLAMLLSAGIIIIAIAGLMTATSSLEFISPFAPHAKGDTLTLNGKGVVDEDGQSLATDSLEDAQSGAMASSEKKKNKKDKKHAKVESGPPVRVGEVIRYNDATFFILYPHTVSVQVDGWIKQLRISVAIETTDDDGARLFDHGFYLLDSLNSILRSADGDALSDPGAFWIRSQLRSQIQEMLPNVEIRSLLLREFIVT